MEKKSFLIGMVAGALLASVIVRMPAPLSPEMAHGASGATPTGVAVALADTPAALPTTIPTAMPTATPTEMPTAMPTATPTAAPTAAGLVALTDVMPDQADLGVSFNDVVVHMVQGGAIDRDKFLQLYADRQPLTPEQKHWLDTPASQTIVISRGNAGLLLNLFWPLGIANKSAVFAEGPMGTNFKKDLPNFASTGGWSLGKTDGGKLVNSLSLVRLTPEQDKMVSSIALHIYRPCCDNSTFMPDCNHGAAMLGFLELAVSQGMSVDEIYRKALILNSYWFPRNYVEVATFVRVKQGQAWKDVDARQVLDATYSSSRGYRAVDSELQAAGLLPKVNGSNNCGT